MSSEFIPLCAPHLEGNEWRYIKDCLDTGWVSSVGSYVDRFERELAARVGASGAVACASGTAALHVALIVAGVEADDEVIIPSLTFIASANAVTYLGAQPVFVDVEPEHFQLDPDKLGAFLTEGCRPDGNGNGNGKCLRNLVTGRRVKAIMPVHVLGHACDMDPILALAARFELAVVEDATEALGTRYKGKPVGTLGELGTFSFNGNKLITTGSGGMIVARDSAQLARAKYLTTQAKDDPLEFVHREIGFNYRLSNVSAALGVAQLERVDAYIARKAEIARRYDEALAELPGLRTPRAAAFCEPNHWLYTVRVDAARFGQGSRELMRTLRAQQIETRPLWQPMHKSPAHAAAFHAPCDVAERLNAECLSLPCSVGLTAADQDRVIRAIAAARR